MFNFQKHTTSSKISGRIQISLTIRWSILPDLLNLSFPSSYRPHIRHKIPLSKDWFVINLDLFLIGAKLCKKKNEIRIACLPSQLSKKAQTTRPEISKMLCPKLGQVFLEKQQQLTIRNPEARSFSMMITAKLSTAISWDKKKKQGRRHSSKLQDAIFLRKDRQRQPTTLTTAFVCRGTISRVLIWASWPNDQTRKQQKLSALVTFLPWVLRSSQKGRMCW